MKPINNGDYFSGTAEINEDDPYHGSDGFIFADLSALPLGEVGKDTPNGSITSLLETELVPSDHVGPEEDM